MNTAASLLTQAQADGVVLVPDPPTGLKLRGDKAALDKWAPRLRPHKDELLSLLVQPDPRQALYAAWLAGIDQPRALVTLDHAQVREAIAAGVVSRDLAAASVLLLVKVPRGESGPGAVGLLAIPRERYADFSPTAALEAMTWAH